MIQNILLINETYEHAIHMHLFRYHHLYMNEIMILCHCYLKKINLENIRRQFLSLIFAFSNPILNFYFYSRYNADFSVYSLFRFIYLLMSYHEKNHFSIPALYWTKNTNIRKMKWLFFYFGNVHFVMKNMNNFLMKNKPFINRNASSLLFSYIFLVLYHITHNCSYI